MSRFVTEEGKKPSPQMVSSDGSWSPTSSRLNLQPCSRRISSQLHVLYFTEAVVSLFTAVCNKSTLIFSVHFHFSLH